MQKTKQLIANKVIEKIKTDLNNGDTTLINIMLNYVPAWDMIHFAFGENDYYKFISENLDIKK